MTTSQAFLPRERSAEQPFPLVQSNNVYGTDPAGAVPNEAYFPGFYPGYSTYITIGNDKQEFHPNVSINAGLNQGQSTIGFRVNKYNPQEWHQNNYAKHYQAFADRNQSEQNRWEANRTENETEHITQRTHALSTKRLAERLHDINFWKNELNREIEDLNFETDHLMQEKRRTQSALDATITPLHIATETLKNRELHRYGIDRVVDEVELELRKEIDLINNVQHLLCKTLDKAEVQIK